MKNSLYNSFRRLGLLLTAILPLMGCGTVWEELQGCRVYVDFRYDYNMQGENLFAAQCNNVEIFVFDAGGVLCYRHAQRGAALAGSGYRMPVPVDYGDYTIVAWGGHSDSYELQDAMLGVSTLDELTLRLKVGADNSHAAELEPLWHGIQHFAYTGDIERVVTVPLVKNTNTISLKLVNTTPHPDMPAEHVAVTLTAANGGYGFDNSLLDNEPVAYLPYDGSAFRISTLRLMEDAEVRLSVTDVNNGSSLLPGSGELDLIGHLLKTCPGTMLRQEYLDREDQWNIEIGYTRDPVKGFLVVLIKINDWVVWTQGTDL